MADSVTDWYYRRRLMQSEATWANFAGQQLTAGCFLAQGRTGWGFRITYRVDCDDIGRWDSFCPRSAVSLVGLRLAGRQRTGMSVRRG